jgi:hypothetical protein
VKKIVVAEVEEVVQKQTSLGQSRMWERLWTAGCRERVARSRAITECRVKTEMNVRDKTEIGVMWIIGIVGLTDEDVFRGEVSTLPEQDEGLTRKLAQ